MAYILTCVVQCFLYQHSDRSAHVTDIRLDHLSVCLSVGLQSVLWQNGRLDPDAVWGGEWGWSRDGRIRLGGDCQREWAILG